MSILFFGGTGDRRKKEEDMAKYLGRGTMIPGAIEEEMVDSRWKTWSIGCDVHVKPVFVAVFIPDYIKGNIQRFVVKYETDYQSLQAMKTWLLAFKKNMAAQSLSLSRHQPIIARLSMPCMENLTPLSLTRH